MATKSEVLCQHFVLQIELVLLGHGLLEQLPNVQRIKVTSNVVGCLSMCVFVCVCVSQITCSILSNQLALCQYFWPAFANQTSIEIVSLSFSLLHKSLEFGLKWRILNVDYAHHFKALFNCI